jgi:hypothetical protein
MAACRGSGQDSHRVSLTVHHVPVATNMVVFEVGGYEDPSEAGGGGGGAGTAAFCDALQRRGVLVFPYGGRGECIRAVTHRHIDEEAVEHVLAAARGVLALA